MANVARVQLSIHRTARGLSYKYISFLLCLLSYPTLCLAAPECVAYIAAVQRTVEITSSSGTCQTATNNAPVYLGDSVHTGKRSKADLKFGTATLLRLGQNATIQIISAKEVKLISGQALLSSPKFGGVIAAPATIKVAD